MPTIHGALAPYLVCLVQSIPQRDGVFLNAPPVVITTMAGDIHAQDNGYIDAGRYLPNFGAVAGSDVTLGNDTFVTGSSNSGSRAGRSFAIVSGVADDGWREPVYGQWGISSYDGNINASVELLAADTLAQIETSKIVVWRGAPPDTSSPTATTCYTYIELCAGSTRNFRIACQYGQPITLQFTDDAGVNWRNVGTSKGQNRSETAFTDRDYVVFYITTIQEQGLISIETSTGTVIQWTPNDSFTTSNVRATWLPSTGRIRVQCKNGWMGFTYQPKRHTAAQVTRVDNLGYTHPNAASAWLSCGALNNQSGLTYSNTVSASGTSYQWTSNVTGTDAGEGLGSAFAPMWTDGQLIVPPDFQLGVPGGVNPTTLLFMAITQMDVEEVLDDNSRLRLVAGEVCITNYKHQYGDAVGNLAMTIWSSNDGGATRWKRGEFVAGIGDDGWIYDNPAAGINNVRSRIQDKSVMLGNGDAVNLGQDVQGDAWCLWSLVRLFCHKGSISNSWLVKLPDAAGAGIYAPPGSTTAAPYGRADGTCPYPVMPSGLGDNPLITFPASMSPWAALQILVQEISLPVYDSFGTLINNLPYYMGFDSDGYFRFEPYDPTSNTITYGFSDVPAAASALWPAVTWIPLDSFTHSISASQLRSDLTISGQDWITNELLVDHRQQSTTVREAIGYYRGMLMQSERWGSFDYLQTVTDGLQHQTSLPNVVCSGSIPHSTRIFTGDTVGILHTGLMGGAAQKFYMTRLRHRVADAPHMELATQFSARYVGSF